MARPVRLTKKQKEIMGVVLRRAGEGIFLSIKEVHQEVSHGSECSYGAVRCSINVLRNANMIVCEAVPGSHSKKVKPTQLGYDWFRPKILPEQIK